MAEATTSTRLGLKAGDEAVIVIWHYGSVRYESTTVAKVTPTGRIKTECDREFNSDGTNRNYSRTYSAKIRPMDDVARDWLDREQASKIIERFGEAMNSPHSGENRECYSTADLRRVADLIAEIEGKSAQPDKENTLS